MGLFGKTKPVDPKEQVNEWGKRIRKEGYNIDRQINAIKREEAKVTRALKEAAKKGDKDVCNILAKELINSRKSITKLYTAKANLNSVQMQMKSQLATVKVAGTLQTSAEVMKSMSQLVKLPEIQKNMMELSREMMKAGVIEEMMEDVMEPLGEEEEMEEAAQEEVDRIITEITTGKLKDAPSAIADTLPAAAGVEAEEPEMEEDQGELEEMQSRLEALRS